MNYQTGNPKTVVLPITTKAKAMAIMVDSLFHPVNRHTLNKGKWCNGKYKAGSFPVGRLMEVPLHVVALWTESRKDSDGPYCVIMCLTKELAK